MKRLILALLLAASPLAVAQSRSTELERAHAAARSAALALKQAEQRRDQGVEPQPGERLGLVDGHSRLTEQYFARQAKLEQEVELARKRYEAAQKRWNDLK